MRRPLKALACWVAIVVGVSSGMLASDGMAALSPQAQQQAVDWINTYVRVPSGLPPIQLDPTVSTAARNHANYLLQNPAEIPAFHLETAGHPGYTGQTPFQRCAEVGAKCNGEDGYWGLQWPLPLLGWMMAPYHGVAWLTSCRVGVASETSPDGKTVTSVADFGDYGRCPGRGDPAVVPNTAGAALHIWPANGTPSLPVTWAGGESPDPLYAWSGDRSNVGPPVYIVNAGPATTATVSLVGPNGNVPLFVPGASSPALSVNIDSFGFVSATAMMAASRLTPGARYTLTVTPNVGATASTTFTTQGAPPIVADRPTLSALRAKGSRNVKITTSVTFHNVALAGPPWRLAVIDYIRVPKPLKVVAVQTHQDAPSQVDAPFIDLAPPTESVTVTLQGEINVPTSLTSLTMRVALVAPTWKTGWLIPAVSMQNISTANWNLPRNLLTVPIRVSP